MDFAGTVNATLWVFCGIGLLSAVVASVGTMADICRGRLPSRGGTIFALSMWVGLSVWWLIAVLAVKTLAIPVYDHAGHAGVTFGAFVVGFVVCIFIDDRLRKVWPAPRSGLVSPNASVVESLVEPLRSLSTVAVRNAPDFPHPPAEIKTALDRAPAVRNPLSAFANTVGTNAQITALQNAARRAEATASTAAAEANGFDAIMRREDRLIELRVRQQIATELEQNKIEEQRDRLLDDKHHRTIAAERRSKDRWDAKRDTTNARHGVEAAKRFKDFKFELGEKRAKARMADVDVDTAT